MCKHVSHQIGRAERHLQSIQLDGVHGLMLGENDFLSREFIQRERSTTGQLVVLIQGMVNKFPMAVNNDDMILTDVGFAAVGGKDFSRLAKFLFMRAQRDKVGVTWQLIDNHYCLVWLTVGGNPVMPYTLDDKTKILKAFGYCQINWHPSMPTPQEMFMVNYEYRSVRRRGFWHPENIPEVDNKDEEH